MKQSITVKQEEKEVLSGESLFRNTLAKFLLLVSAILLLGSFAILFFFVGKRDVPIVLHYNVYFGVDVIGEWWEVYFVPFVGVLFLFLHIVLARYLFSLGEKTLSFGVLISLVFLLVLVTIAAGTVAFVNY